ncbi:MAG: hypothetical protein ABJB12_12900 [Pseudomonadota bacterium]
MPNSNPNARRSRFAGLAAHLAGSLAAALLLGAGAAPADEFPVFLGNVGVGRANPELRTELRALLRAEIRSADFAHVKTRERYVLAATLLRLDSTQSSDSVRATCVISVALLRDKGATLYALINGSATAEEAKAQVDIARSDALRGAVHSAMARVPQALR